jgi:hypothetical protein
LLPSQIVSFLVHVAVAVLGVLALAFLYVTFSPWIQRQLSALLKGIVSRDQS